MPVQDDERETQLVQLFNLTVPDDRRRDETDAYLELPDGSSVPFELKSTSGASISTVRDFGPAHVRKWQGMHWLFGFYDPTGNRLLYCHYGSPAAMREWVAGRWAYVRPDWELARTAPQRIGLAEVEAILGARESYTLQDARAIQKRQYSRAEYRSRVDLPNSEYSPEAMIAILRDRATYLMERGATLNNPKIPATYFIGWERIVRDHAARLRELHAEASALGDPPPLI
ncbi:hypothetical protein [Nitriliruptor alkaliphilus]|uniref:hypothetical protein n=1 Tax=Nitriliruptor alkaliphilus TaxID=427918 RepID=UPI000697934A|nr:hypothetical protein [Nitriliruptor alkaliphilus]